MTPIRNLPQPVSHPNRTFPAAFSGGLAMYINQNKYFARYVTYAIQALEEYNLIPPDADSLTQIVESALLWSFRASSLLYPSAIPSQPNSTRSSRCSSLIVSWPQRNGVIHEPTYTKADHHPNRVRTFNARIGSHGQWPRCLEAKSLSPSPSVSQHPIS
jgi:hypothetical protein